MVGIGSRVLALFEQQFKIKIKFIGSYLKGLFGYVILCLFITNWMQ